MSHRVKITDDKTGLDVTIPVIAAQDAETCQECGREKECRPYGHLGARICYDCARKNVARTEHNMAIQLFGHAGELL